MTTNQVSKDSIEAVRQLLLASALEERTDDRYAKKAAVRQLLAAVMAARGSGMSFDQIAAVFSKGGLAISPETLRSYYFELKGEQEIAAEARRHADRVERVRKSMERQREQKHQLHGERVALEHVTRNEGESQVAATKEALSSVVQNDQQGVGLPSSSVRLEKRGGQPPLLGEAVRPSRPPMAGARMSPLQAAATEQPVKRDRKSPAPISASIETSKVPPTPAGHSVAPRTLDEVEQESERHESFVPLADDVIVKDGFVLHLDGSPFNGWLTRKQVMLLRQTGRLAATVRGESSKTFVRMPDRL